ncbi:MAG: glutamine synthetase III, partial [Cyclobacteriaceae bacterium]
MARLRFEALNQLSKRSKVQVDVPSKKISDFFGEDAFGTKEMLGSLAPAVFKKVSEAIKNHEKIDAETADAVASAAKSWA